MHFPQTQMLPLDCHLQMSHYCHHYRCHYHHCHHRCYLQVQESRPGWPSILLRVLRTQDQTNTHRALLPFGCLRHPRRCQRLFDRLLPPDPTRR